MRSGLVVAVVTFVASSAGTAVVLDMLRGRPVPSDRLHVREVASEVLEERRDVLVHLPESYTREPGRRYPVVYVLDGSSLDGPTADSAALMARIGLMPELIVVGIPNVSGKGRQRDYTPPFMVQDLDEPDSPKGGADRFLDFLERELMPVIDREYRTEPTRMVAGHSRGGLLVCYSLMAKPGLFDARFAHSPALWREDGLLADRLAQFLQSRPRLDGFLYLSMGSEENDQMMAAFDRTRSILDAWAVPTGLGWHADLVAGADHGTNGAMATPLGFKALFADRLRLPGSATLP